MKNILTKDLLKSKLSDWTLSKDVVEKLGFASKDDAQIKRELLAFEKKGFIERVGNKKGLKFKYKEDKKSDISENFEEFSEAQTDIIEEAKPSLNQTTEVYLKQRDKDKAEIKDQKSLKDSLNFLIKSNPTEDSGISSYTLSLKKVGDNFQIRIYAGILVMSEQYLSQENFIKYLNKAGVNFNNE